MNILMMTNTYLPLVGGVSRSVASFCDMYRAHGHQVLIIAPTFEHATDDPPYVVRVPAIQNFNGSDFSVRLPIPGLLDDELEAFRPEIVHSHHPFLLGDTALRVAATWDVPLVFTHHTMYEQYTHYVPGDSPALQRFVMTLATEYANLAEHVIAPSESVAAVLRERGVTTPITTIPTGIMPEDFCHGDGSRARRRWNLPAEAFVIGHVGRLAVEKNLPMLAQAVARMIAMHPDAHFLVVGSGPAEAEVRAAFDEAQLADRLHMTGPLQGESLADAYHAMDIFAFSSQSETQGMVLAEAMTAGVPVVAVDAPGAREVVRDRKNGRLLASDDPDEFAAALAWVANRTPAQRQALVDSARATAEMFAMPHCADRVLALYADCIAAGRQSGVTDDTGPWAATLRRIEEEWNLLARFGQAVGSALRGSAAPDDEVRSPSA